MFLIFIRTIVKLILDLPTWTFKRCVDTLDIVERNILDNFYLSSSKCAPRLSASASEKLVSHFVEVRGKVKEMRKDVSGARNGVPITVRYP